MGLTPKQQLFVHEYLVDLNATQAAIRAGYSAKTAEQIGYKLLKNPKVKAAIDAKTQKRLGDLDVTADRVLCELACIGYSNMLDYIKVGDNGMALVDLSKLTREQAAAISSIETEEFTERTGADTEGKPTFENVRRVKFRMHDKPSSLSMLGRHLKLFAANTLDVNLRVVDREAVLAKLTGRTAKKPA